MKKWPLRTTCKVVHVAGTNFTLIYSYLEYRFGVGKSVVLVPRDALERISFSIYINVIKNLVHENKGFQLERLGFF